MLKVLSLFSGIGAFEKALERQGIEYQLVNYCEIDKYASKAYSLIHNVSEQMNLGDITKIDTFELDDDIDIITHGSPCQDFSVAGNQAGGDKGSNTRSSLMWNTVDIVKHVRPKVVLWENVKNLLGKKHRHNFDSYIQIMDELGYNSYYKVLNAKDYGIPQNRERVYTISIRKDIDSGDFKFPEPFELKLRLKDMLESTVEEKYFLSDQFLKGLKQHNQNHHKKGTGFIWKPKTGDETANCLRANAALCPTDNTVIVASRGRYDENGNVEQHLEINDTGCTNTLTTVQKDNYVLEPKKAIIDDNDTYVNKKYREFVDENGYVPDMFNPYHKTEVKEIAPTQTTYCGSTTSSATVLVNTNAIKDEQKLHGAYGRNFGSKGKLQDKDSVCDTLLSAMGSGGGNVPIVKEKENEPKLIQVGQIYGTEREPNPQAGRVYDANGLSPTMDSCSGGNRMPKVVVQEINVVNPMPDGTCRTIKHQYANTSIANTVRTGSMGATMVSEKLPSDIGQNEKNQVYNIKDKHVNLSGRDGNERNYPVNLKDGSYRIRKLTPRECFRLMGFDDSDFDKVEGKLSNSQLYKMAGNSIVVNVLEEIYKQLFKAIKL